MKKIRLDPEALEVHSFDTASPAHGRRGTIRGHSGTYGTYDFTCTYGASCLGDACRPDSWVTACLC
jgi:hypothetical protein